MKMAKNKDKKNIDIDSNEAHNADDDVVFDDIDEEGKSLETAKKLREKLKQCEEERREYLTGWQRSKADYINMRKRDEEARISAIKSAKEDVIVGVIPVLDSFEMAFSGEHHESVDENWIKGIRGIETQLLRTLGEYGVIQMYPLGEEFDPNLHDSVESKPTDNENENGKIIEVRQKGYSIDGKIIRAAKVVVAEFRN